jgi:hypothetical protein
VQNHPPRPRITYTGARAALASGKWSVAALVVSFIVTAVLVPVAAHLPRWVEVELVIGAWWAVWVCALAYLLHRTCGISDDATAPSSPRWLRGRSGSSSDSSSDASGCLHLADPGCADLSLAGEGCAQAVIAVVCIALIVVGASLVVELVIPGLAFLMYVLIRGMLARALSGREDCQDSVVRSLLWGTFWATVYTLPLALAVWGVHVIRVGGH